MIRGRTPAIDGMPRKAALHQRLCSAIVVQVGSGHLRTGPVPSCLLKVGMPPSKQGPLAKDRWIVDLIKTPGYATAHIVRNRLGNRNEFLPTVHRFDAVIRPSRDRSRGPSGGCPSWRI